MPSLPVVAAPTTSMPSSSRRSRARLSENIWWSSISRTVIGWGSRSASELLSEGSKQLLGAPRLVEQPSREHGIAEVVARHQHHRQRRSALDELPGQLVASH